MSCGRRLCKRSLRTTTFYCRCGTEFCSEACFVSEWHADHQRSCPFAADIKRDLAEKKPGSRSTALLVDTALSKTKPTPPVVTAPASATHETDKSAEKPALHVELPEAPVSNPFGGALPATAPWSAAPSADSPPKVGTGETPTARVAQPGAEMQATAVVPAMPAPHGDAAVPSRPAETASPFRPAELVPPIPHADSVSSSRLPSKPAESAPARRQQDLDSSYSSSYHHRQDLDSTSSSTFSSSSVDRESGSPDSHQRRGERMKWLRRYDFSEFEDLKESLGGGSYGQVTKVRHRETGVIFAMKAIPKKKVLEHQMTPYLKREVSTQMRLRHQNILRLHYFFEDADNVHLLLEYASGGSLFSVLRKRRFLPEPEAAEILVDVGSALAYLHKHHIAHRDLKPENILMCDDIAKLADFGWCAELSRGAQRNTFCGTWDYLSPEMVQSEPHDSAVDVWATGVLIYEMLTGRPPFAAQSQVKAMNRIMTVDLQFPSSIPELARNLICALVVKDPSARLKLTDALQHPWVQRHAPKRLAAASTGEVQKRVEPIPKKASPPLAPPVSSLSGTGAAPRSENPPPKAPSAGLHTDELSASQRAEALRAKLEAIANGVTTAAAATKTRTGEAGKTGTSGLLASSSKPTHASEVVPPIQGFSEHMSKATASSLSGINDDPKQGARTAPVPPPGGPPPSDLPPSQGPGLSVLPWQRGPAISPQATPRENQTSSSLSTRSRSHTVAGSAMGPDAPDRFASSGSTADLVSALNESTRSQQRRGTTDVSELDVSSKKEPWQTTETFARLRTWMRKNSGGVTTDLGEELDKSLPDGTREPGSPSRAAGFGGGLGTSDVLAALRNGLSHSPSRASNHHGGGGDGLRRGGGYPNAGGPTGGSGYGDGTSRATGGRTTKRMDASVSPLEVFKVGALDPRAESPSGGLPSSHAYGAAGRERMGGAGGINPGAFAGVLGSGSQQPRGYSDSPNRRHRTSRPLSVPDAAVGGAPPWEEINADLDTMTSTMRGKLDQIMKELDTPEGDFAAPPAPSSDFSPTRNQHRRYL